MNLTTESMAAEAELVGEIIKEEMYKNLTVKDDFINDWVLVRTPIPCATVLSLYLLFVVKVGPRFMANRKPFELKNTMRLYNVLQMLYNAWQMYNIAGNLKVMQVVVEMSCSFASHEHYEELRYAYLSYSWNYYVSKMIDLFDTVFMVLRKKDDNVTFLHVYHHAAMVFFVWATLYFTQSHHAVFPGLMNVSVHTIMYGYYFLATFPTLKKYLWWKKHLTKIQLMQFVAILAYIYMLYNSGCQISPAFTYMWLFNVGLIFVLFINFYIRAYIFSQKRDHRKTS